eukprot:3941904-Rhodomonas_salina.1
MEKKQEGGGDPLCAHSVPEMLNNERGGGGQVERVECSTVARGAKTNVINEGWALFVPDVWLNAVDFAECFCSEINVIIDSVCCYHATYAMSGTEIAYDATSVASTLTPSGACPIILRCCYAMPGTEIAYDTISLCDVRCALFPTILHACYAMPGTGIAYGAITLRPCYAMPGTDMAYGAIGLCDAYTICYWCAMQY